MCSSEAGRKDGDGDGHGPHAVMAGNECACPLLPCLSLGCPDPVRYHPGRHPVFVRLRLRRRSACLVIQVLARAAVLTPADHAGRVMASACLPANLALLPNRSRPLADARRKAACYGRAVKINALRPNSYRFRPRQARELSAPQHFSSIRAAFHAPRPTPVVELPTPVHRAPA